MAFLKEYEILGELGKVGGGAFAQVYQVRHIELGYVRAIRVLKELITNNKQYEDFINECKFLLRLGNSGHPNIVRVYQPRLIDNKAFWEMDYIEGSPVDSFIEQNKGFISMAEINRFMLDISSALAYCHVDNYKFSLSRDEDKDLITIDSSDGNKLIISDENRQKLIKKYCVVHNDIKSNNVMRKFDGSYILLDFGLAFGTNKQLSRSSLMNHGGVEYKAPEKWDGDTEQMTERTDIYSFGVTLYEMLAGRVPFPYNNKFSPEQANHEVSEHHKNTDPPPIEPLRKAAYEEATGKPYQKDYPDWLEHLIMKCLEKKPEKRYKNGKELFEEVKTLIEKENKPKVIEKTVEVEKVVEVEKIVEKPVKVKVTKPIWVILAVLFFLTSIIFLAMYLQQPEMTETGSSDNTTAQLTTKLDNLQQQLIDKQTEIDRLNNKIQSLEKELSNVGDSSGLQKIIEDKNKEIDQLETDKISLKNQNEALQKTIDKQEKKTPEITTLNNNLNKVRADYDDLLKSYTDVQKQITTLKKTIDERDKTIAEKQKVIDKLIGGM